MLPEGRIYINVSALRQIYKKKRKKKGKKSVEYVSEYVKKEK